MANKYLIYTVCTNNYDKIPKPKIYQGFDYFIVPKKQYFSTYVATKPFVFGRVLIQF